MLKNKKLFLFDIDGTIALDDKLFDGTMDLLTYISNNGGTSMYISNNSTKSREDYVAKFANWDIQVPTKHFMTASFVTCLYMKAKYKTEKIFVIGTQSFVEELRASGLYVTEDPETDVSCVLVGFDRELTFKKLENACQLLSNHKIDFVATSPDLCCPVSFGFIPDCGSICQMISNAVNRKPFVVGKPNPLMIELCIRESGHSKEETLVVGDRLYTDIASGINAKVDTAVVLTGEATQADLGDTKFPPDFAFATIRDLYEEIIEE